MARRHVGKLHPPADKKSILANEEGVRPLAPKSCEGCIDLRAGAGVEDLDLQSHGAGSGLHVSQRGLCARSIGRIDEHGNTRHCGHQLTQELQPLCCQLNTEKIDPCRVATREWNALMRPTDLGRISDCGRPSAFAQCLNLEHEIHQTVSQLCILGFELGE